MTVIRPAFKIYIMHLFPDLCRLLLQFVNLLYFYEVIFYHISFIKLST